MSDMTVAKTILSQLGGGKLIAMTGAKDFVGGEKSLSFRIPRARKAITHVRIVLTPADLYDVTFLTMRKLEVREVAKHSDIYAEDLQDIFTAETGLYTRL